MRLHSLQTRLIILYTSLILLGFGGLAIWGGRQIEQAAEEDFEHRAESEVAILARALTEPIEHYLEGEASQARVLSILQRYADQTQSHLNLMNNQGKIWLSTQASPADVSLNSPEILAAHQNRITHETRRDASGEWMIYTAAPIIEDGRTISLVQLIIPAENVQAAIRRRWLMLGLGVGILALVVVFISVVLSASLTRPLNHLRTAALQISQGDFSAPVPDQRRDEIGQVAQAFRIMSKQVQAMLDEQRAFASNVSHELRTPLTAIQLRIEALLTGHLDSAKQNRYLHEVEAEIGRMRNLVDDLILLSRLEAGSIELGRDQVDLPRLARQLIKEMQALAAEKKITLILEADETLPALSANLTHLQVVFRNILENAIKYIDDGGGKVHWKITLDGEYILNSISDTGCGIAPEELDAVLKRFYRADKSRSRLIQGAGLGLSLVKTIVEAYGGDIKLSSEGIGQGTTVQIWWRL